jgi:proteasome lid subunit RPN8/RPN11
VSGRIEVNRSLPPVSMPARLLNELRSHALETWPEECCGLLVGDAPGRFESAHRCRNDMTRLHRQDPITWPRDGTKAFHMNEIDYLRVREQAEASGERVTGVYHSHVDAGAYFSELDQVYVRQPLFPFPDAQHIVLSVLEGRVRDVALFRIDAGSGRFEGRSVVPMPEVA